MTDFAVKFSFTTRQLAETWPFMSPPIECGQLIPPKHPPTLNYRPTAAALINSPVTLCPVALNCKNPKLNCTKITELGTIYYLERTWTRVQEFKAFQCSGATLKLPQFLVLLLVLLLCSSSGSSNWLSILCARHGTNGNWSGRHTHSQSRASSSCGA